MLVYTINLNDKPTNVLHITYDDIKMADNADDALNQLHNIHDMLTEEAIDGITDESYAILGHVSVILFNESEQMPV